jgi:hypothetical protein
VGNFSQLGTVGISRAGRICNLILVNSIFFYLANLNHNKKKLACIDNIKIDNGLHITENLSKSDHFL